MDGKIRILIVSSLIAPRFYPGKSMERQASKEQKFLIVFCPEAIHIWEIPDGQTVSGTTSKIVWLEKGTKKAGLTHIIENHHKEFL